MSVECRRRRICVNLLIVVFPASYFCALIMGPSSRKKENVCLLSSTEQKHVETHKEVLCCSAE